MTNSQPGQLERLLNQKQAAEVLGLSTRTVERLRLAGGGPRFAKLGRRVLYRPADLNAWVAAQIVGSTSERGIGK